MSRKNRKDKRYFEVVVRQIREGTFLVEAPGDAKEGEVESDLGDCNLILGDISLDSDNGWLVSDDHFEPHTEIKASRLKQKPRGKKPNFRMVPRDPDDPDSELEPEVI